MGSGNGHRVLRYSFAAASVAEIRRSDSSATKGAHIFLAPGGLFQTPATTLSELATLVTPEMTVILTDRAGDSVRGRVMSISERSLAFAGHNKPFTEGDCREVRARLRDSPWDGGAIGFAVGFAISALVCTSRSDSSETIPCVVGFVLLGACPVWDSASRPTRCGRVR